MSARKRRIIPWAHTWVRPYVYNQSICPTSGDPSTILLRKIASGTAQDDNFASHRIVLLRHGGDSFAGEHVEGGDERLPELLLLDYAVDVAVLRGVVG